MSVIKANEIQDLNGNVILNTNNRIKFLQVVSVETTQQVTSTAYQVYYDLANSVSLTTVGENSSFFIIGYAPVYSNSTSVSRHNIGFSVTNGSTTTRISGVDSSLGDSWGSNAAISATGVTLNRSTLWTPNTQINSNVTLTFNLLGARYDTAGISYWNLSTYSHNNTITVMEFAA
jgi:hypothetical protein